MAESTENRPKHCRIHRNGRALSIHINAELAEIIKDCFPPMHDYSALYNPEKKTLTIFPPQPPT